MSSPTKGLELPLVGLLTQDKSQDPVTWGAVLDNDRGNRDPQHDGPYARQRPLGRGHALPRRGRLANGTLLLLAGLDAGFYGLAIVRPEGVVSLGSRQGSAFITYGDDHWESSSVTGDGLAGRTAELPSSPTESCLRRSGKEVNRPSKYLKAMSADKISVALATEAIPMLRQGLEEEYHVPSLDKAGPGVRGLVVAASLGVSNIDLEKLIDLEIVSSFGVGLDKIDLDFAAKLGLVVANTPRVLDEAVAEHAMALLLAASRRVCEADAFVREGEWLNGRFPLARGLSGKRCGIVGLGNIGHQIAKRCEPFGLHLAYHARQPRENVAYEYFEDLWALAHESDILVLAVPGGPETEGMVDADILRTLGPTGLLVNISRGSVVDEEALIEALEFGDLGGAALDVFSDEPNVPEALLRLPNVVLTPHLGSATEECRQTMLELTMANLRAHFAGRPVPGLVRPS